MFWQESCLQSVYIYKNTKIMKHLKIIVPMLALLLACNGHQGSENAYADDAVPGYSGYVSEQNEYTAEDVEVDETVPLTSRANAEKQVKRKLIKQGYVAFEAKDLAATHNRILQQVARAEGYLAEDAQAKEYNRIVYNLTVRIPSQKFDAFVAELEKGVAYFDEKNIGIQDVTEQFVDLESRIKTKKDLEQRYLSLLDKAKTVEDMLRIEREVGQLRSDIEAMEGRMNVMKNQISFATLRISFYKTEVETVRGNDHRFLQALNNGWQGVVNFLVGVTAAWPLLLFGFIIAFIVYRRFKK